MNLKNGNPEHRLEKVTRIGFEVEDDFDLIINNKLEKIIYASLITYSEDRFSCQSNC